MFNKILIANRGEIACRIINTARRMAIKTVAVYSEPDAGARHADLADEAYFIGPALARDSYLNQDAIIAAARISGAEAIHPGYGFLSENADFAEICRDAGIIFIGPPPEAIRTMGSKSRAKDLMERAGVPLVPGYHGADQSPDVLRDAAERIGYPVLLKASAGGGGRGMRVVTEDSEFAEAIDRAKGEARASFGDDTILVEKYLTHPRHIEVQIFADQHGNYVSLFERDCSIQRRHQKVLEESPGPTIAPAQRRALGDTAIAAARAVNYVGAGTVEFIYQDGQYYFMEMNTRLQVEHPVTEFVTGLDLVEWQFRVAAGEMLPRTQNEIPLRGHAIEARICAEDPARDFMPAAGKILFLQEPAPSKHVRVDGAPRQGDVISPHYDSMIAKLIVWDEDRAGAIRQMAQALAQYQLVGPSTNLDLLRNIVSHPAFAAGDFHTGFIGQHPEVIMPFADPSPTVWATAALAALPRCPNPASDPWEQSDGWRMNGPAKVRILLAYGANTNTIHARSGDRGQWLLDLPTGPFETSLLEQNQSRLTIVPHGNMITVIENGRNYSFTLIDPLAPPGAESAPLTRLLAPTPARVVQIFVEPGTMVAKGDKLLVLESMKMDTTFLAPRDGVIEAVHVRPDEHVPEGAELISFQSEPRP